MEIQNPKDCRDKYKKDLFVKRKKSKYKQSPNNVTRQRIIRKKAGFTID